MSTHTCSTCSADSAQFRCSLCKRFAFCGDNCYLNHPEHEDLCWDRSSKDPYYVADMLESVIPIMVDEHYRFTAEQMEAAGDLVNELNSGETDLIEMAHQCIDDVIHGDNPHIGVLTRGMRRRRRRRRRKKQQRKDDKKQAKLDARRKAREKEAEEDAAKKSKASEKKTKRKEKRKATLGKLKEGAKGLVAKAKEKLRGRRARGGDANVSWPINTNIGQPIKYESIKYDITPEDYAEWEHLFDEEHPDYDIDNEIFMDMLHQMHHDEVGEEYITIDGLLSYTKSLMTQSGRERLKEKVQQWKRNPSEENEAKLADLRKKAALWRKTAIRRKSREDLDDLINMIDN